MPSLNSIINSITIPERTASKPMNLSNTTAIKTKKSLKRSKPCQPLQSIVQLSRFDVICGRGKRCEEHYGNQQFRRIVDGHLEAYAGATSKVDKSIVVSEILNAVRSSSPNGGFVRRNSKTGHYEAVTDRVAREKVGQMLRDSLNAQYRSSLGSKRRNRNDKICMESQRVEQNKDIAMAIDALREDVAEDMDDDMVERVFLSTNLFILSELKRYPMTAITSGAA